MAKQVIAERELVSIPVAATMLDISPETMWQWVYEGRIASLKLGRCRKIAIKEIHRFMQANTIPAK